MSPETIKELRSSYKLRDMSARF